MLCIIYRIIWVGCLCERKKIHSKINTADFLPDDEVSYLKQIFLFLLGLLFIIGLFLSFVVSDPVNDYQIAWLSILFATIGIIYVAEKSYYKFILAVLATPVIGITWILFAQDLPLLLKIVEYTGIIIMGIYIFYNFIKYTKNNQLGLTVIIFGIIISLTTISTIVGEEVTFIDSVVMVSNAFTSNGYAILGTTYVGKINSIILVWTGYILSGVGTAGLAAAIIVNYMRKKLNILYKQNEDLSKELKELKELIKKE